MQKLLSYAIAGAALAAAAVGVLRHFGPHAKDSSAIPTAAADRTAHSRGTRITSEWARRQLSRLFDGTLKPPHGEDWEAKGRYYQKTAAWIQALSLPDCLALIEAAEASRNSYSLLEPLYARYGELDAHGAIAWFGGDTAEGVESIRASDRLYIFSQVIRGWGHTEPAEAWRYCQGLIRENGGSVLREAGMYWYLPLELFQSWAKRAPSEAWEALEKAAPEEQAPGAVGYYEGIPDQMDFAKEAARLEELLGRSQLQTAWENPNYPAKQTLSLLLTRKWADTQPAEALEWWRRFAAAGEVETEEQRAYRAGQFAAEWAGVWERNNPDGVLRWLEGRGDLLQYRDFVEKALPPLARDRPSATIALLMQIGSADERAYQLARFVREPTFSGEDRYRRRDLSAVLDPDLVAASLPRFHFNREQQERVNEAIRGRREYEASRTVWPASGW